MTTESHNNLPLPRAAAQAQQIAQHIQRTFAGAALLGAPRLQLQRNTLATQLMRYTAVPVRATDWAATLVRRATLGRG